MSNHDDQSGAEAQPGQEAPPERPFDADQDFDAKPVIPAPWRAESETGAPAADPEPSVRLASEQESESGTDLWGELIEHAGAIERLARKLAGTTRESGGFQVIRPAIRLADDPGSRMGVEDGISQLRAQVEQLRVEFDRVVDELVHELEELRDRQDALARSELERGRGWWQRLVEPGEAQG